MTPEQERKTEQTVTVSVEFKRTTMDRIEEASATLGLTPAQYCGVAATSAAKDDLLRLDRFQRRWMPGVSR